MYRKIYISSASRRLSPEALADLLAVSRRNNARDDLTGLLAYHDGNFLQILEGSQDRVRACYNRIVGDSRHRQIIAISEGPAEDRLFGQWAMGLADPRGVAGREPCGVASLLSLADELVFFGTRDPTATAMLNTFLSSFRDMQVARPA